jgi:hypothetical protein
MQISFKNGVYFTATTTLVGGIAFAWPQQEKLAGYALILLSAALFVWGVNIKPSFWRRRINLREEQWMPLCRVLSYIIYKSDWASRTTLDAHAPPDAVLAKELLEALARGDVSARGRRVISQFPYQLAAASELIPTDFWAYAFIQPFGELVINEPTRGVAATDGKFTSIDDRRCYREVTLKRDQVLSIWPQATARLGENVFSKAVASYWQSYRSNPNREYEDAFSVATAGNLKTDC